MIWKTLLNGRALNKQSFLFNESTVDIFFNFVLSKLVTFVYSDPPWVTNFVKNKIR